MRGQLFAEFLSIARKRAPFVPQDSQRLTKRFAFVRYAGKAQRVTVSLHTRGDDGDPVPGLGERQQRMRRMTLNQYIRRKSCQPADCVKRLARCKTRIQ